MRSNSETRTGTWAPCIGSVESYPLDYQGSPENSFFLPFPASRDCCIPWLMTLPPSSQPMRANWILSSLHSDLVCLPLPLFGTLVMTLGPPGSPKIIFLLEGQQNSKLNSICNLISLLPCDETLAQNLGVRMRASLGSHHSTYHMVRSTVEKNRARYGNFGVLRGQWVMLLNRVKLITLGR